MTEDLLEYFLSLNPSISDANLDIIRKVDLNPRSLRLPKEEIVQALTGEGMNRLTALDVVTSAQQEWQYRDECLQHPLGIFWDIENIRIPKTKSGEQISELIKRAVRPFGNPVVCNAYFESSDNATIPSTKRQKLQQSGWNLMDVEHCFKKEVADKVILVDMLLFIMEHSMRSNHNNSGQDETNSLNTAARPSVKQPVTVCLISDDDDFSYLLAKLKAYPHVKTVIISRRDNLCSSNAHTSLRWYVDVLKMPITPSAVEEEDRSEMDTAVPPGVVSVPVTVAVPVSCSVQPVPHSESEADLAAYSDDDTRSISQRDVDDYDRRCLRRVMELLNERYPERYGQHKKSMVGIMLLGMNPSAYGDRSVRSAIFDQAIHDGWLRQMGTKGDCTVEMVR